MEICFTLNSLTIHGKDLLFFWASEVFGCKDSWSLAWIFATLILAHVVWRYWIQFTVSLCEWGGHFLNRSYGSQRMTTYARIQNFLKVGSEGVIVFCGGGGWRLGFWGLFFGKFIMNLINKDFSGLGVSRFGHATSLVLLLCSR